MEEINIMKRKNICFPVFVLAALLGLYSCTRNFEELGKNPNQIEKPTPDLLLASSVRNAMDFYGGDFNRVVMFNYTQHFAGFQGDFQRYASDVTTLNNYWRDAWMPVKDIHEVIEIYGDDQAYHNRVLIARIWKIYLLSQIAAIWGPIPYENGLDGKIVIPYNREQDLYYMMLDDLKECAEGLDPEGDYYTKDLLLGTQISDNVTMASDIVKWKKFANSLRLRLAMRISNSAPDGDPVKAQEVVEEVFQQEDLTITSDDETVACKWGGNITTQGGDVNPLYERAIYNKLANLGSLPVFGETAVYHMKPYGDPRLPIYAEPVVQKKVDGTVPVHAGEYFGDTNSYGGYGGNSGIEVSADQRIHSGLTREDYSPIGSRFTAADAEFIFLSCAEVCFLKAEARLLGWGNTSSKSAEDYYYEGIRASMSHYDILESDVAAYLETPGIKWGTATKTTNDLGEDISAQFMDWLKLCSSIVGQNDFRHQIVMQHWLAIPNQGVDAWTLMRRTQELQFEPCFSPPDGTYRYLPYRLEYPVNEIQYNGPEVEKAINSYLTPRGIFRGNDMYVKLWFALPNKAIDGIPNPTDYL